MDREEEYEQVLSDEEKEIDYGGWVRGKKLGGCGSGFVHLAIVKEPRAAHLKDFPPVMAVKSFENESKRAELENESLVLRRLGDCPHVIRYLGEEESQDEDGIKRLKVFLELALGGPLSSLLHVSRGGRLDEDEARRYTRSILAGLKRIHDEGFVHCNLHPCNILLVKEGTEMVAKVADFGTAKRAGEGGAAKGSLFCRAPEGVRGEVQEKPGDVWALGCTLVTMLGGKMLPLGKDNFVTVLLPVGNKISWEAKDFVSECFVVKAEKRSTVEDLMNHPFLTGRKGWKQWKRSLIYFILIGYLMLLVWVLVINYFPFLL